MTTALLDDHLLRDLLADELSEELAAVVDDHELATTNLYLYRLCRSVVSARGGSLTGSWPIARRRQLASGLVTLPGTVAVVPMQTLAYRMAEIADLHRVSTLGAEAVAAAQHLGGTLCVWQGDDGPGIRAAATSLEVGYRTIDR